MTDGEDTPRDWPRLISEVLDEARRHAGNGPLLAEELQRLGVGPEGRYSESAISNWVKGRAMPPADVLLAAAALGGISLDGKLGAGATVTAISGSGPDASTVDALAEEVHQLNRQVAQLQGRLMHLYSRVGEPYPHETDSDTAADARTARRSKAAGQ